MSWIWVQALNWGFRALSAGAMGVGILMTRGRVRLLLTVALGLFLLELVLHLLPVGDASQAAMIAFSVVQGVLNVALTATFVAAAVVGVREVRAKDAKIAELSSEQTHDTWAQPEGSPDPRLLAD